VGCPTVVLHGERDSLVRASQLSQLSRLQPGWTVKVLEGVGHSPHLEALHRTTAAVQDLALGAGEASRALTERADGSAITVQVPAHPVADLARRAVDLAALSPTLTVED
jgi:hypothetical protein